MIAYRARSRTKMILLFFIVAFILAAVGVYLYFFRHKEPTHGVFVYNEYSIEEGVTDHGHIYTTP